MVEGAIGEVQDRIRKVMQNVRPRKQYGSCDRKEKFSPKGRTTAGMSYRAERSA